MNSSFENISVGMGDWIGFSSSAKHLRTHMAFLSAEVISDAGEAC
jgi:hypothetical protein